MTKDIKQELLEEFKDNYSDVPMYINDASRTGPAHGTSGFGDLTFKEMIDEFSSALDTYRDAVVREVLKALPPEIIIHEYIPSENTGENRGWNDYRNAAIKALLPQEEKND